MTYQAKTWVWWLAFPFAHNNFTTIGETIYHPKGHEPSGGILAHEAIHSRQQKDVGLFKFLALYLFAFPILWNPWRFKWEYEAYQSGSQYSDSKIYPILRSFRYGWLINRGN